MTTRPAITSQKERYGSVDGERRGGPRLHDVCRVVGLLDDDCRDSGVGRKEHRPVHKINHFQSRTATFYYKVPNLIFLQMSEYQAGDKVLFVLGNMNSEKRVWN